MLTTELNTYVYIQYNTEKYQIIPKNEPALL